jgi:hypothetical protein
MALALARARSAGQAAPVLAGLGLEEHFRRDSAVAPEVAPESAEIVALAPRELAPGLEGQKCQERKMRCR